MQTYSFKLLINKTNKQSFSFAFNVAAMLIDITNNKNGLVCLYTRLCNVLLYEQNKEVPKSNNANDLNYSLPASTQATPRYKVI